MLLFHVFVLVTVGFFFLKSSIRTRPNDILSFEPMHTRTVLCVYIPHPFQRLFIQGGFESPRTKGALLFQLHTAFQLRAPYRTRRKRPGIPPVSDTVEKPETRQTDQSIHR